MRNISLESDPTSAMLIGVYWAVLGLVGIPANLFVLIATLAAKSLRSVPLNTFVFSLALGDTMFLISSQSSLLWAIFYDDDICKVMGVGIYIFLLMSIMIVPCLAVCRYAAICEESNQSKVMKFFRKRFGIFTLNVFVWCFASVYPVPLILNGNFGLDVVGVCGIGKLDSIIPFVYYFVCVLVVLFASYIITLIYYRKLSRWVAEKSSEITASLNSRETLRVTRNLMRMMKWIMIFPLFVFSPASMITLLLRYNPKIVSVVIARIFISSIPLCSVINPIVTLAFVRKYRIIVVKIIARNRVRVAGTTIITRTNRQPSLQANLDTNSVPVIRIRLASDPE